jgi:hypothetical protein
MNCKICESARFPFGEAVIMRRHTVGFYQCNSCGFVQTQDPYWLDEAYEEPIQTTDVGYVSRNLKLADVTASVIASCFDPAGQFLDFGGGYGLLVRLLRDRGLDFYRDDPYCENLLARGFDRPDAARYELVTAFEVAEHLPDPVASFEAMLSYSDNILFTTELMTNPAPAPGGWWYYSLETGQHVSLYTEDALHALADRLNLKIVTSPSRDRHLLTTNRRALRWFPLVSRYSVARFVGRARRRPSLLQHDYERLVAESS